jgi:hypothetical protein
MTSRPNVTVSGVRVTWKMGNRINKYKCIIDSGRTRAASGIYAPAAQLFRKPSEAIDDGRRVDRLRNMMREAW